MKYNHYLDLRTGSVYRVKVAKHSSFVAECFVHYLRGWYNLSDTDVFSDENIGVLTIDELPKRIWRISCII